MIWDILNTDAYLVSAIAVIFLLLLFWIIRLEIKLRKLLGNKSGTLDESIDHLRKQVDYLRKFSEKTVEHFDTMDKKMQSVVSGMHTVRFNPFKGTGHGSNQSFATAFVNDKGDGVVISSLYSREHVSIFSKPISKMTSEYELTAEEREALQKAKESIE